MITMTKEEIRKYNPHRDPIQLVDEVLSLVPGESVKAVFHIPEDMAIFQGHFPGNPVYPGVYSIESMAQAANLMLMPLDRYKGKIPLLYKINHAVFRAQIKPGDTVILEAELVQESKQKGIITSRCRSVVDGIVAAECEIVAAMR